MLLLTAFIANAQSDKGDFELGGNIGLNFSNIAISGANMPTTSTSSRTSFNISATGEYYFSDRWGIKAKIIIDNKGWSDNFINIFDDNGDVIETKNGDTVLNYISVPVMANWHFGKKRNWYLNFGLYYASLVNAEIAEIDVSESFNTSDAGLTFGIGVKFPISDKAKLFIEYDAQSGFSNIAKESGAATVSNGRSSLNIGVLFNL